MTEDKSKELAHIDASIVEQFANQQSKHEVIEVLKELFDTDKILLISSFKRDEIGLSTRIKAIAHIRGIGVWDDVINTLATLRLSEDRRSRNEVIEAVKGYQERKNMFQRMFTGNNMTQRRF